MSTLSNIPPSPFVGASARCHTPQQQSRSGRASTPTQCTGSATGAGAGNGRHLSHTTSALNFSSNGSAATRHTPTISAWFSTDRGGTNANISTDNKSSNNFNTSCSALNNSGVFSLNQSQSFQLMSPVTGTPHSSRVRPSTPTGSNSSFTNSLGNSPQYFRSAVPANMSAMNTPRTGPLRSSRAGSLNEFSGATPVRTPLRASTPGGITATGRGMYTPSSRSRNNSNVPTPHNPPNTSSALDDIISNHGNAAGSPLLNNTYTSFSMATQRGGRMPVSNAILKTHSVDIEESVCSSNGYSHSHTTGTSAESYVNVSKSTGLISTTAAPAPTLRRLATPTRRPSSANPIELQAAGHHNHHTSGDVRRGSTMDNATVAVQLDFESTATATRCSNAGSPRSHGSPSPVLHPGTAPTSAQHALCAALPNGETNSASAPSSSRINSSSNGASARQQLTISGSHHQQQQQHPPFCASDASRSILRDFVKRWQNKAHENQAAYKEGGYMPVKPGTQIGTAPSSSGKGNSHRYVLIHKLGWGEFSTVWLAYDKRATESRYAFVAIKIAKCHTSITDSSKYEVNLMRFLRKTLPSTSPSIPLLDAFEHTGEYGTHLCMVMPVLGSNLLCVIDQMKAKRHRRRDPRDITMIKEITISVLQGLVDLEQLQVLHTDLKPENIICACPDPNVSRMIQSFLANNAESTKHVDAVAASKTGDPHHLVALADFGLSVLLESPAGLSTNPAAAAVGPKRGFKVPRRGIVHNSNGILIQTREYRAPEILLGCDFCARTDVWSVGCIVYELITGEFLMDPKRRTTNERDMDIEHLAMMMQIIGPVPTRIAGAVGRAKQQQQNGGPAVSVPRYIHRYFTEDGQFLYADRYRHLSRRSLATELEVYLEPSEAERAAQFIMSCFTYDPMERCHASDLLRHSWLKTAL